MNRYTPPKKPYRRASPEELAERRTVIATMLKEGKGPGPISEAVGVSNNRIRETIRNDKDLAALFQAQKKQEVQLPPVGALTRAARNEDAAFQTWLQDSVPGGSTLAEFLISVAVDAYQDETAAACISSKR